MSRIGIQPIQVPGNVNVASDNGVVTVDGPKGKLMCKIAPSLAMNIEDGVLTVSRPDSDRFNRSQHGLARTLIANMVQGVTQGHSKALEVHGVGYRAQAAGRKLTLSLGYSHPVEITAPDGIDFEVKADDKSRITQIVVSGIDKALVGQVAADIRKARKPDPYKGKGVRYKGEAIKLRPGKRAGK